MQNTDFLPSCDGFCRTRTVSILGNDVRVKNYICSPDGITYREKPENVKLQLSVCPVSFCPADCPFCIAGDTKTLRKLDLKAFERTMILLKREDRVRGVGITGGEPFYDMGLLDEVISVLFEVFGLELEISINTNGMWLDQIHRIRHLERLDAIHISRHHYDDAVNRRLFGRAPVPSGEKLKEIIDTVSYKDLFVLNCLLLRDYIGSPTEAHKFLDFAISTGAQKVGFMMCSPVNGFAAEQTVSYDSVLKDDDASLLFTRRFFDYDICSCRDGVYASPSGDIIEFYGRVTSSGRCGYSRGLVYDADNHLRDGFGGNVIV